MTEEEEERFRLTGLLPRGRRWEPLDEGLDEHKMAHAVYEAWMEREYRVYDRNRYYGRISVGHSTTNRDEPTIEFESFTGNYFRYVWSKDYPVYPAFRRAQEEEPEDEGDGPVPVETAPRERFKSFAEAEAEKED